MDISIGRHFREYLNSLAPISNAEYNTCSIYFQPLRLNKAILGSGAGSIPRAATSKRYFVYTKPKDQTEENLIKLKKSQLIIESQAVGTGFIPPHKFKANFPDYCIFRKFILVCG